MGKIICKKCGDSSYFIATYNGLYCNKCGTKHVRKAKPVPGLLDTFLSILTPLLSEVEEAVVEKESCDFCGITWEEIASTGRLGCAKDYSVFKDRLTPWLEHIHGSSQHKSSK